MATGHALPAMNGIRMDAASNKASVLDVINHILDDNMNASQTWQRLQQQHPEFIPNPKLGTKVHTKVYTELLVQPSGAFALQKM